nr:MAPEG family protein [Hyphomonas sp. Mor2]
MSGLEVASVYIAVNILILIWLAFRVVTHRRKGRISLGDGGSEDLTRAIRAHGNASEYIPVILIGLLALAFLEAPNWVIHALGATFTFGRLIHPVGMTGGPIILRQLGILLSWICLVILSLVLLYFAFN